MSRGGKRRLLVAFRERIRLDQARLVHHFELTGWQHFADAGLAPQVMVVVDFDVAFRGGVQLDARGSGNHFIDVKAAGFFHRGDGRVDVRQIGN